MNLQQSQKQCLQCKTALPANADFCPECGTRDESQLNTNSSQAQYQTIGALKTVAPNSGRLEDLDREVFQPGTRFANRYEILELVGMGGMGVVYKARDEVTQKTIALKLIHPKAASSHLDLERLKEEGITSRDIRHKHVVAVYDVGLDGDQPFITMEYLKGRTLREWISFWQLGEMNIPVAEAIRVMAQVFAGLEAAPRSWRCSLRLEARKHPAGS